MKPESPLGWALITEPLEVVPFNDIGDHSRGEECACQPEMDDDTIVHNAWDGRELYAVGRRKHH